MPRETNMSIGWFVDGSYVYKTFGKVDYAKVRALIEEELSDTIEDAYYVNADEDPPRAEALHRALSKPPPDGPGLRTKVFWLSKKPLYWPKNMGGNQVLHPDTGDPYILTTQKSVDVGLAYYLVKSYHNRGWTKLVLGAGDGDFHVPVQDLVENLNVDLYLIGTTGSISPQLAPYARGIWDSNVEPIRSRIELRRKLPGG